MGVLVVLINDKVMTEDLRSACPMVVSIKLTISWSFTMIIMDFKN